jgi:hypothetical protein
MHKQISIIVQVIYIWFLEHKSTCTVNYIDFTVFVRNNKMFNKLTCRMLNDIFNSDVIGNVISLGEIPVFISLENLCISQASM